MEEKATDRAVDREPSDTSATIDGNITPDVADRFAETIRPSWVQLSPAQSVHKESDPSDQDTNKSADLVSVVTRSSSGREDTDAELKLAAESILRSKKVRRKPLLWIGGAAACFFALIVFSVATQKEQETSLWKSEKADKLAPLERIRKEKSTEAKSGVALKSESPTEPTVKPGESAVDPPVNRAEEPQSDPQTNNLAASSQAVAQPTSKSIAEDPEQESSQPPQVHIRVSTVPATANLILDGTSVPNPFDQFVPKEGSHLFVASASGYANKSRRITFDQDKELSLRLDPVKKKRREVRRTAKKSSSRKKRVRNVSRRSKKPTQSASRTRTSRKSFVTENPY